MNSKVWVFFSCMWVSFFWDARILISSCFAKVSQNFFFFLFSLFFLFILCRLVWLSLAAANLCYTWAALQLLKTPEAKPSCLLHQLIENLATECPQQVTQQFRWLPTQRLLKVSKCELKKKSKTWQWLRKALHLLAWSQTQLSALMMMMRKTVTPLPPQLPAVFPPRRSSEKRTAVCLCVHFCISTTRM